MSAARSEYLLLKTEFVKSSTTCSGSVSGSNRCNGCSVGHDVKGAIVFRWAAVQKAGHMQLLVTL
eukprot:3465483-Prorocentrum_lima.AAC.1